MKRFLFSLLVVLGISGIASARGFQIQAGYGGYSQMDATKMSDGVKTKTSWGTVTGGFTYRVVPKFRLGATYTFSSTTSKNSEADVYYHVVLANGFYDFYRRGDLKLYSHLGLGFDISHITLDAPRGHGSWSENKSYFAFQISPIGAEYNIGSGCNLFGELGFGAQGLLQVGVRVNI